MSIKGITGYKFTLGIPFAGYVKISMIPSWIGISMQNSVYMIYGFYVSNIKGGGVCEEGFNIVSNIDATIFYL